MRITEDASTLPPDQYFDDEFQIISELIAGKVRRASEFVRAWERESKVSNYLDAE